MKKKCKIKHINRGIYCGKVLICILSPRILLCHLVLAAVCRHTFYVDSSSKFSWYQFRNLRSRCSCCPNYLSPSLVSSLPLQAFLDLSVSFRPPSLTLLAWWSFGLLTAFHQPRLLNRYRQSCFQSVPLSYAVSRILATELHFARVRTLRAEVLLTSHTGVIFLLNFMEIEKYVMSE